MAVFFIGFLFSACDGVLKKDVRAFIEGSYVRDFKNEFAVGVDSVVISAEGADNYLITKYSRFSRIKNGQVLPNAGKHERMFGVYDQEKNVIHEQQKGKVLSFNPEKGTMMIGASEYKKVK